MIQIARVALDSELAARLDGRTAQLSSENAGSTGARKAWESADWERKRVREHLNSMARGVQRCMYCGDNLGTDIDHFEPISRAPIRTFEWINHLLACSFCNSSQKRHLFPCDQSGSPLLIDPTSDDPARHLTLNTGKYRALTPKGQHSIEVFGLNREDLARGRAAAFMTGRATICHAKSLLDQGRRDEAVHFVAALAEEPLGSVVQAIVRSVHMPGAEQVLGADVVAALEEPVLMGLLRRTSLRPNTIAWVEHLVTRRQALGGLAGAAVAACGSIHAGAGTTTATVRHVTKPAGTILWRTPIPSLAESLVIAGRIVCAGITPTGSDGLFVMYALDADSGHVAWIVKNRNDLIPFAAGQGLLYCEGGGGIWAVSTAGGRVAWSNPAFVLGGPDYTGLEYSAGTVFAASTGDRRYGGDPVIAAIDAASGTTRWIAARGIGVTAFGVSGDRVYYGKPVAPYTGASEFVALDSATGAPIWTHRDPRLLPGMLAITRDTVVFTASQVARGGTGSAGLDAATGSLLWQSKGWELLSLAPAGDLVIGLTSSLTAIEARTGKTVWRRADAGQREYLTSAVLGSTVCASVATGARLDLAGFATADGRELWRHPVGGLATFAGGDGVIYAAVTPAFDGPGHIYAIAA